MGEYKVQVTAMPAQIQKVLEEVRSKKIDQAKELKPIAGGALPAIPAEPIDQDYKMQISGGLAGATFTDATLPGGKVDLASDEIGTLWFDGKTRKYSLVDKQKLPLAPAVGKVEDGDSRPVSGSEVKYFFNNYLGQKVSIKDWKPRNNTDKNYKIGQLFEEIDLLLNKDLKKANGDLRKIYINSVQNVNNQYYIRAFVEKLDGTFDIYFKTGGKKDFLDIGIGTIFYTFVDVTKLPVNNNTNATYEQGALLESYVSFAYDNFISKNLSKTINTVDYVICPATDVSIKRFYIFKSNFESTSTIKKMTINGLRKGMKFILVEVRKNETSHVLVKKSNTYTADGLSDSISVDFTISQNNYLGFQLLEGVIKSASPIIPSQVVRWDVYTGDVSDFTELDNASVNTRGDYPLIGFSTENKSRTITDVFELIKKNIPSAQNYSIDLFKKNELRSFLENPVYLRSPDGYNQFLHPQVLYFAEKLFGYKYWLTVTPFPSTALLYADYYENPCIYASNNGLDWVQPAQNPIDKIEDSQIASKGYMSDPCLCVKDGILELWYRRHPVSSSGNPTYICELLRKTSTDGINWSSREIMVPDMNRTLTFEFISPKIYWDGSKYVCYYTDLNTSNLARAFSINGKEWTDFTPCTGLNTNIHADITIHEGVYYAILHNVTGGKEKLLVYTSYDGLAFSNRTEILTLDDFSFYSDVFYKSTILNNGRDFLVYFTGGYISSNGKYIRKIGLMKGKSIAELKVVNANSVNNLFVEGSIKLVNTQVKSSAINFSEKDALLYDASREMLNKGVEADMYPLFTFKK